MEIKDWNWGDNFVLPVLVIFVTIIPLPLWRFFGRKLTSFSQKIRYLRREASCDIFTNCIFNPNFKKSHAFDKIEILRKLRLKSLKKQNSSHNGYFATDSFRGFVERVYSNPRFVNKKLRRKIYKTWLKEYNRLKKEESDFHRYFNGKMSYDEDIQFQKKLGIIKD